MLSSYNWQHGPYNPRLIKLTKCKENTHFQCLILLPHHANHVGSILTMIEKAGFSIHTMSMLQLTLLVAERFYACASPFS